MSVFRTLEPWLIGAFGVVSLGNAAWMIVAPYHWYLELPAGVPDFGPYNVHFVRDIGSAYLMVGAALVWAVFAPAYRVPLIGAALVFTAAHAAVHVFDMLRGAVDAHHWWLDLPGVYAPSVLLVVLLVSSARRESTKGERHAT